MASVNKVLLIGNLGKDPDIRYMPNGDAVANFSIATTDTWKDKQGQKQERTEWHNIVMYSRLAEIAGQYLKKGSQVYIEGRLQTRKWQDKNTGADRYTTEIIANEMKMLGSKGSSGNSSAEYDAPPAAYNEAPRSAPAASSAPSAPKPAAPNKSFDDGFEDDIPF